MRADTAPDDRPSFIHLLDGSASLDPTVLLDLETVCPWLGQSRSSVYELVLSGELPSLKLGRSRRVPVGAVRDFVAEQLAQSGE